MVGTQTRQNVWRESTKECDETDEAMRGDVYECHFFSFDFSLFSFLVFFRLRLDLSNFSLAVEARFVRLPFPFPFKLSYILN